MARYLGGGRGLQLYTEFRDADGNIVRLADSSLEAIPSVDGSS